MPKILDWRHLRCEPMTSCDIQRIMPIEAHAYRFHWSEQNFLDCLKPPFASMVLTMGADLIGYYVLFIAAAESQLLNIAVGAEYWGRGIGSELLQLAMAQSRNNGAAEMFLEVRASNIRAQRLYKSAGFAQIGLRQGYYQSSTGREDAYVMRTCL